MNNDFINKNIKSYYRCHYKQHDKCSFIQNNIALSPEKYSRKKSLLQLNSRSSVFSENFNASQIHSLPGAVKRKQLINVDSVNTSKFLKLKYDLNLSTNLLNSVNYKNDSIIGNQRPPLYFKKKNINNTTNILGKPVFRTSLVKPMSQPGLVLKSKKGQK